MILSDMLCNWFLMSFVICGMKYKEQLVSKCTTLIIQNGKAGNRQVQRE